MFNKYVAFRERIPFWHLDEKKERRALQSVVESLSDRVDKLERENDLLKKATKYVVHRERISGGVPFHVYDGETITIQEAITAIMKYLSIKFETIEPVAKGVKVVEDDT